MITIFKQAIENFYPLFYKFEDSVGKPNLIEESGLFQFDYPEKNIPTICLIKMARILSSLNAIVILFENGYIVEIGVIIRTIKEACADLSFLLKDYPENNPTKSQQQYIDEFFKEEFQNPQDPINTARKHNRVPSKKIHAGFARNMYKMSKLIKIEKLRRRVQKIINPSEHQSSTQIILNIWSGYVHYGYRQSVEIFGGTRPEYHFNGLSGTPKMNEWQDILVTEFFAVYNHFLDICLKFKFLEEFEILKSKQIEFQEKTGYNPQMP